MSYEGIRSADGSIKCCRQPGSEFYQSRGRRNRSHDGAGRHGQFLAAECSAAADFAQAIQAATQADFRSGAASRRCGRDSPACGPSIRIVDRSSARAGLAARRITRRSCTYRGT